MTARLLAAPLLHDTGVNRFVPFVLSLRCGLWGHFGCPGLKVFDITLKKKPKNPGFRSITPFGFLFLCTYVRKHVCTCCVYVLELVLGRRQSALMGESASP